MSKFVLDQLNKALQDKKSPVRIPPLDKKAFLPLLGELKKHKGLTLVDARLGDGTKVIVRL